MCVGFSGFRAGSLLDSPLLGGMSFRNFVKDERKYARATEIRDLNTVFLCLLLCLPYL